jgi:N-acetyl-gamma-glutamylphosphate reductase
MNPYQTAKEQGYSDQEIMNYLSKHPKYSQKIKTARDQNYSDEEISNYLSGNEPHKEQEEPQERTLGE